MEACPRPVIEALVGLLIPPACREHVLGDLYERYTSPGQYVADAARTLPFVVCSQVLRTTSTRLLVAEAAALFLAFLTAAAQFALPQLSQPSMLRQVTVPALVALVAIVLRDAYTEPQGRPPQAVAVDAGFGIAFALVSQAVLAAIQPNLVLPRLVAIAGGGFGLLLLSAVRMASPPVSRGVGAASVAGATIPHEPLVRSRSMKVERRMWWVSRVYLFPALRVCWSFVGRMLSRRACVSRGDRRTRYSGPPDEKR